MPQDQEHGKHDRLAQGLELVEAINTFVDDFGPLMDAAGGVFQVWKATLEPVFRDFEPILERLRDLIEQVGPHVEKLVRHQRIERQFSNVGWLPYYSELIGQVEQHEGDAISLDNMVSEYYRDHSDEIRKDMEGRIGSYEIDEEARETIREVFSAHESENYRSVCRTLFPELERMIKRSFFNDSGRIRTADMVRKLAERLAGSEVLSREGFCLVTIGHHVKHMYAQVDDDERYRFEQNSIPNRHAALHGLVSYSTHKHSMNMIIMADYLFQILPTRAVDTHDEHAGEITTDAPGHRHSASG